MLIAAVATAVAVWALLRSPSTPPSPVTRSVIPLAPGEQLFLTNRPSLAISPDGQRVAYVTTRGSTSQLYLRAMKELDGKPIDGTEGASMPFFSPDGQWLGFAQGGRLMKVSVNGGALILLCEVSATPRGASWASDGSIIFVPGSHQGLHRIREDGSEPEVLKVPNREGGEKSYRFPEVLPGGRAVVFTLGTSTIESWDDAAIALLSLETGEYRILLEGGSHALYSPTGHLVYARNGSLFAAPFALDTLELTGASVAVLQGIITSPTKGPAAFSVSGSGSLVYAPGDPWGIDLRVALVDRNGRSEPLIEAPRAFEYGVPSPDGRSLILAIDDANAGLWVYDVARTTLTRLVSGFDNMSPVWTPDGKRLAFSSNRGGSFSAFLQAADGSGEAERLASGHPQSWAPSGESLALMEGNPQTGWDITVVAFEDDQSQQFLHTPSNEAFPKFSPDGRWIAYESDESGRYEIYVRSFPDSGAKWQVSTEGGRLPTWSPNGREIFYRSGDAMMGVDIDTEGTIALGKPRSLFEWDFVISANNVASYYLMPDGQRFVMIDGSGSPPPPTQLVLVQNWAEELERVVSNDN